MGTLAGVGTVKIRGAEQGNFNEDRLRDRHQVGNAAALLAQWRVVTGNWTLCPRSTPLRLLNQLLEPWENMLLW